jgi:hypothetical protein
MRRAVYGVMFIFLAACGGGGAKQAGSTSAAPTTPDASSTAASTSAEGNPVKGADFCAFLSQQTPRLKADGSTAGALADLAIEFAGWLDTHKSEKPRTAADLDEASTSACPATRAAVLATLGKDSFDAALS